MTDNKGEHLPDQLPPMPPSQQQMALATTVPVVPVPTAFNLDIVGQVIALRTQTPTGIHVVFLEADQADALAHHLRNAATRARSGLVMPDPTMTSRINGHKLGGAA